MRRTLLLSLITVTAILLALLASGFWLVGTESGTRWLLRQGLEQAPGEARVTAVNGTLLTTLNISGLSWRDGELQLRLEQLHLNPDWWALSRSELRLESLLGRGLRLDLPAAGQQPLDDEARTAGEADWPVPTLPLPVSISRLALNDIRIQQGDVRHEFTRAALAGSARGRRLKLDYLALQQEQRHVTVTGKLTFASPWRLDTEVTWGLPLPESVAPYVKGALAYGQGQLRGPITDLNVNHRLHYPQTVRSRGSIQPFSDPLSLDLRHQWSRLRFNLPDGRQLTLAEGELSTKGSPDDYRLALDAGTSALNGLPALRPRLRARGDGDGLRIRELSLEGEPGQVLVDGTVNWTPELSWELNLKGRKLNPNLLDERLAGQLNLDARVNGRLPAEAPLELNLDLKRLEGQLNGETLQASGQAGMTGTSEVRIETLALTSRHGTAQLSGTVGWAPHLNWTLDLQGSDWNPALLDKRLPGRINLDGRVTGALPAQAPPELELRLRELGGTLREQPLNGSGELALRGMKHFRGDLDLALGENRVDLSGHRNETSDLTLKVNAPSLASLWPELAGALEGRIRMSGTPTQPVLEGQLEGRNLAWATWSLDNVALEMRPPSEQGQQHLSLRTGEARRDERVLFNGLELQWRGPMDNHRLDWTLKRAEHQLAGTLEGGLDEGNWQGRLGALHLTGPLSGEWRQAEPAQLQASAEQLQLASLCLQADQDQGRICVDGGWQSPDHGELNLSLAGMPLAPLAPLLPSGARVEGRLNGEGELSLDAGQPQGRFELNADNGTFLLRADGDEPVRIPWRQFSANASLEQGQWRLSTRLKRGDSDFLQGYASGPLNPEYGELAGHLETRLTDLSWLELLVPRLREPEGRLEGALSLSGTMTEPVFDGRITLREGNVRIPGAGLALREMEMTASTDARGKLLFDGSARSGDGQLTLNGQLETDRKPPWPLQLQIEGKEFLALDRPDARLVLNPDLDLRLVGRHLKLRGDVQVPAARFEPRQLGGQAVRVSSDVHRVNEEEAVQTPWKADIDVGVKLGNEVRFRGFGLEARFAGEVRYRDPVDQVPRMTGEVRVPEGRYRAYGQRLNIERGRLLFEGPPDNPGLDIIAVRPLPNSETRVGLEVGGTLREPNARVFSEPALEQSEAMALLLTGRPLSGTSGGERDAVLQAISRYGLERGEFLTSPLSESLGVDVGVESSETTEGTTALTLGKQLSDRLYVQYSMGLFESLSTVMLRYSITPRLSLETRSSGEAQGADLIYRLQRD